MIIDTVVHSAASILTGLPTIICSMAMLVIQTIISVFITSGSGMAAAFSAVTMVVVPKPTYDELSYPTTPHLKKRIDILISNKQASLATLFIDYRLDCLTNLYIYSYFCTLYIKVNLFGLLSTYSFKVSDISISVKSRVFLILTILHFSGSLILNIFIAPAIASCSSLITIGMYSVQ